MWINEKKTANDMDCVFPSHLCPRLGENWKKIESQAGFLRGKIREEMIRWHNRKRYIFALVCQKRRGANDITKLALAGEGTTTDSYK